MEFGIWNLVLVWHLVLTRGGFMEKKYDLEDRTELFAKKIIMLCKKIEYSTTSQELIKQMVRAGTSVGANYREANEAVGKNDFLYRLRIARKEAKEVEYWLSLAQTADATCNDIAGELRREAVELRNILSSILAKSE